MGTDVIMVLKEDADNEDYSHFLEEYTLADLVKKYSASANAFIKFSLRFLAPLLVLVVVATGV